MSLCRCGHAKEHHKMADRLPRCTKCGCLAFRARALDPAPYSNPKHPVRRGGKR